jgi:hypothetical protein
MQGPLYPALGFEANASVLEAADHGDRKIGFFEL